MKLIKLHAYLQNNVGDDLMVEILLDRYPDYRFWCCRGMQKKTEKLNHQIRYIDNEDIYKKWGRINHICNFFTRKKNLVYKCVFRALEKKCICSISIGGSIFREIIGQPLSERISYEENKKALDTPFFVIGANFGPYQTHEFYESFYNYFSTCQGVSFRDQYSFGLFKNIHNVCWGPDLVFNIEKGVIHDGSDVLISVINLEKREALREYSKAYIDKIIEVCDYWISKGKSPVLTSFCDFEGDQEYVDAIYDLIVMPNRTKVKKYYYQGNTDEILELFRNAHFIVATRFHAMILAMRLNKPLFTISYEMKMDNILDDTNSVAYTHVSELSKYSPELMYQLGKAPIDIEDYISKAALQFEKLDDYLKIHKGNRLCRKYL